jgi:DNA-binding response OmpR family regulator
MRGRRLTRDGQPVPTKPREFDLLFHLVARAGQPCTRADLLRNVWGSERLEDSRTIDVHIRWIRSKIEDDPAHPVRLLTVRNIGYVFVG